jgi:hypothetical protein
MGGAKTVNARKYISRPDSSNDIAILMAMQQAQMQQQAQQAALMKAASEMPPEQQFYDPLKQSKRLAEIGMANAQKAKELEMQASPEAAAIREAQARELALLTSPQGANQYINQWTGRQGLIQGLETGLQDSSIGRAAMYDSALKARQNYEQQNLALQQQLLQQTQAPVGGIDPASSISAQQAAQARNLQSMQNWKNSMYGNVGAYNQSTADQMAQMGVNFQNLQETAAQDKQNYTNAMMQNQAQNEAGRNAMNSAYLQAGGSIIQGAAGGIGSAYGAGGSAAGGGLNSSGFYGSKLAGANAYGVAPNQLSQQSSTGLGGFMGIGKQGGYYYNPSGLYRS